MRLSDLDIQNARERGMLDVDPFRPDHLQPASIDLTLDRRLKFLHPATEVLNPKAPVQMVEVDMLPTGFILQPGDQCLASTVETVSLSPAVQGEVWGKSSLARIFLSVHATAGYIDPGFRGQVTLELMNQSGRGILLTPGMKIGQVAFHLLNTPTSRPYGTPGLGSKYQDQVGPTESKYHQNYLRIQTPERERV